MRGFRGVSLCVLFLLSVNHAQRIICTGTSITEGSGYTQLLGAMLGPGYAIINEGKTGTTALTSGDNPYCECNKFSSVFRDNPAIITMEFGTNDARNYTWRWANQARFTADLSAMVDTFATIATRPHIWLCLPAPAWPNGFGVNNDTIEKRIIPAIRLIAAAKGIPVIDLHTPFVACKSWFSADGVHPDAGSPVADSIARIMAHAIASNPVMKLSGRTLEFQSIIGQAPNPADLVDTVINWGTGTTLDPVTSANQAAWLSVTVDGSDKNAQRLINHISIDLAPVTQRDTIYWDTVTVSASNASPASITYAAKLRVRAAPILSSIKIIPDSTHVPNNASLQFTARGIDQYGIVMSSAPSIVWTASGGTVSGSGLYTAGDISQQGLFPVTALAGALSDTARIDVSPITYLPQGRITRMLVLTSNGSPYIPKGSGTISTSFLGIHDSSIVPVENGRVTINSIPYVWTVMNDADGMWFDQTPQDNFVVYGALYVYSRDSLKRVYLRYHYDENCRAYCNRSLIINDTAGKDGGIQKVSPFKFLAKGMNTFVFKIIENTGDNYFSVRIADSAGMDVTSLGYQFSPIPPAVGVRRTTPARGSGTMIVRAAAGWIRMDFASRENRTIELIRPDGSLALANELDQTRIVLPLKAAGIYLVRITSTGGVMTRKVAAW